MGKKQFKVDMLSKKSIQSLKKELENYQKSLSEKCEEVVRQLAELGIQTAKENVGGYGKYISFSVELEPETTGCKALMVATSTGVIKSQWKTLDGIKEADVNPLLLVEFGSGFKAQNPKNIPGVGQGTFPGQTHAFDEGGWSWQDIDGNWHHTTGVSPKMPMYNASLEIIHAVDETVKRVFGT